MSKLGIPLAVLLLLTVFAAGMTDAALPISAIVVAVGVAFSRPPVAKPVRGLWWLGIIAFVWLLITLVPLPLANFGGERIRYFGEMQGTLSERPAVSSATTSPATQAEAESASEEGAESVVWGRLTLNFSGTLRFIILLGLGWGMLWMSSSMSATHRRTFLRCVFIGGTLVAILGLLGRFVFPTGNHVWWLIPMKHAVGGQPFVNRNHFASFCAMLVPLGVCLTLAPNLRIPDRNSLKKSAGGHKPTGGVDAGAEQKHEKRHHQSKQQSDWFLRLFYGLCLVILVSAVVMSLSRGGMLAMVVGALAAASFWLRGHPVLATGGTVVVIAVIMAFVFWPNQAVQERVRTLSNLEEASPLRVQMRHEAFAQWRDFSIIGAGAESFRTLYGNYRSRPGTQAPKYVENEYAQLLAELGAVGMITFILWVLVYTACIYACLHRDSSSRRHKPSILGGHVWSSSKHSWPDEFAVVVTAIAVGTAVVLLFHFAVDFALRIPLNAALAGALLGVGMPLLEQSRDVRRSFWLPRVAPYSLVMVALIAAAMSWGLHLDERSELAEAGVPKLVQSLESAPGYWYPWYQVARAYMLAASEQGNADDSTGSAASAAELREFGMRCFEVAAKYNKSHPTVQFELAKARYSFNGLVNKEVRNAFRRAVRLAPEKQKFWNEWMRAETETGGIDAAWNVAEVAEELASNTRAVAVWKKILAMHEDEGALSKAYEAILNITRLAPSDYAMVRKRSRMEMRMGMTSAAAASLAKAAELRPNNHQVWMELGTLELKRGNDLRANEAFTKATRIKPELREKVDKIWSESRQSAGSRDNETDDGPLFDF